MLYIWNDNGRYVTKFADVVVIDWAVEPRPKRPGSQFWLVEEPSSDAAQQQASAVDDNRHVRLHRHHVNHHGNHHENVNDEAVLPQLMLRVLTKSTE